MRESVLLTLNGCATDVKALVKKKTAHTLSSSNHWSVTENNTNNSWNVNFSNGNTNNNNKNNSNVGRAVAALGEEELVSWIEASDDCCRNKKTSRQCTEYRIRMEEILPVLALAVKKRTYQPSVSECFVVKYPKLREIFAAHFLDRIVQHWITLRIEPLFEDLFIRTGDVSFNCRKGYGTLRAVKTFAGKVEQVTGGYTRDAYIGRFDVSSFFMSMDKDILWKDLEQFIEKCYYGKDKDTLLWLTEITVKHRPQDNCVRKGDLSLWDKLPARKSLFTTDGMAIGNITSQLMANFYLNRFDEKARRSCEEHGGFYVRFVDDFVVVLPKKEDVLAFRRMASEFLGRHINLTLHPGKVYVQHASKGVKFVGSVIKPGRVYLSNRTLGRMHDMLRGMERFCKSVPRRNPKTVQCAELEHYVCACNSYMGFLKYNNSYALKRKMFGRMRHFWKVATISGHYGKVRLRKHFRMAERLLQTDNFLTQKRKFYGSILFSRNARKKHSEGRKTYLELQCT